MENYKFKEVELKWQKRWENEPCFRAKDFDVKPKYYILYEFFNVSGNLHMGHLKGTVPADALARYKRFKGYNVLFPIGGDAFGLPAENAAIKTGTPPEEFVKNGMKNIINQSKKIGLSFDWSRVFATSDPEYYKWTQWIFIQFLKQGKAYKQKGVVNFCPKCCTVLSNEDSQGGKCDRCGSPVQQVNRNVWFLKMREYADKLLTNIDHINMADNLKEAQRHWIGKTEGVELHLDIVNENGHKVGVLSIYTTCIETVYGITFVVLAPENSIIETLKSNIKNYDKVSEYIKQTALKSELNRISQIKEKSGCVLDGIYAVNPVTKKRVPMYIADFVIADSGTGAVMSVPCHDQRDYEFAKKFNIPMIQVVEGDCSSHAIEKDEYMESNGKLINSAQFSGLSVKDAKIAIEKMIEKCGYGEKRVNYKMKDWAFNRQRYWGEPIPVVFCDKCGVVPVEEDKLPLKLPKTEDYLPNANGDSPLSKITEFVNCKCPKCGSLAKRETDTMPNWAGSSWYWLRYIDPHNSKCIADYEKLKYWGSVDVYTGGVEHITRHVLYAFFWQNFLYELGIVPTRDPFIRKMGSGLILDDEGKKMSKSSKNGISPLVVIDEYGADVARMHIHFLAGYEDNCQWTFKGIEGIVNFLNNVWNLQEMIKGEEVSQNREIELNTLIKKAENDYENLKLNTCIASCMAFVKKIKKDGYITREELRQFLIILNPIAPHITSELYEIVFNKNIVNEMFPTYNEDKLHKKTIGMPIQINGKFKCIIDVEHDSDKDTIIRKFINMNKYDVSVENIKKIIFVPNKIVNIIV